MARVEDALKEFRKYADEDPFNTWLITDFPEEINTAIRNSDTAVLSKQITNLSDFASIIVQTAHPDKTILSKNEEFLLFSKFANESELVSGDIPLPLTTINDIMEIYKYTMWAGAELIPFSDKVEIIGDIIDKYLSWCGEHNCLDFITSVEEAISIVKHGSFTVNKIILAIDKPTNAMMKKFKEALLLLDHIEIPITSEKHQTNQIMVKYSSNKVEIKDILEQAATLIESGVNPNDILIISPSVAQSEAYIREIIDEFYVTDAEGIPHTLEYECMDAGLTLSQNPIIIAAISALSSISTGYSLADLENVLASEYFTKRPTKNLTPGLLHHISAISGITKDKNSWVHLKDRIHLVAKEKHHENLSGMNRFSTEIDELCNLIDWLEPLNNGSTYREYAQNYINWLYSTGWTLAGTEDEHPRKAFLTLLETIITSPVSSLPCTTVDFFYHVVHFANDKVLGTTTRNSNSIRLAGMRTSRPALATHVFIIGMSAESIPHIFSALPPLEEEETVILLPNLKRELYEYELSCFTNALDLSKEFLQISYAGTSNNKSKTPSSFLMNLGTIENAEKRELKHSIIWNQNKAGKAIVSTEPVEFSPVGISEPNNLIARIEGESSGNIYNTNFSSSEEFSHEYTDERIYTASMLESYLKCPYIWFIKNHLGLYNPYDESSEDAILGNVIHRTLDRFFREYHNSVTEETVGEARKVLFEIAKEEFDRANVHTPSWEAKSRIYLGESLHTSPLNAFLDFEIELESNGWRENKTEHRITTTIENNNRKMNFYGETDRIVENDQNQFQIIDYKAGIKFNYNSKRNIQVPLYAAAYQSYSGKQPVNGYYLMMNAVSSKKTLSKSGELASKKPIDEKITSTMELCFSAIDNMQNGNCLPTEKCSVKNCKYRYICHKTEDDSEEAEQ